MPEQPVAGDPPASTPLAAVPVIAGSGHVTDAVADDDVLARRVTTGAPSPFLGRPVSTKPTTSGFTTAAALLAEYAKPASDLSPVPEKAARTSFLQSPSGLPSPAAASSPSSAAGSVPRPSMVASHGSSSASHGSSSAPAAVTPSPSLRLPPPPPHSPAPTVSSSSNGSRGHSSAASSSAGPAMVLADKLRPTKLEDIVGQVLLAAYVVQGSLLLLSV
jgi:hypothetical protein